MSDLENLKHRITGELDAGPILRYSTEGEERLKIVGDVINLKVTQDGGDFVLTGKISEDRDSVNRRFSTYDGIATFIKEDVFFE